jgi:hypothetical protein
MIDIFQIEQWLGSFSYNPIRNCKEFLHFTWDYALTGGKIYNIINESLTEDKKETIWKAVEQYADQLHENIPIDNPCYWGND